MKKLDSQEEIHELQLTDIWKFLIRQKTVIFIGVLVCTVTAYVAYLRSPVQYTATATVEMNRDSSSGLGLQDLSGVTTLLGSGQEFTIDMLTQQSVLRSDSTALSVINGLGLRWKAPYNSFPKGKAGDVYREEQKLSLDYATQTRARDIALFQSKLRVEPVKSTRLLTVSFTDSDPLLAAQIANGVVESYLTNHTKSRYEATSKASKWLRDQLEDLKAQTDQIHRQVASMEQSTGLIAMSVPSRAASNTSSGFESVASSPEYQQLSALSADVTKAEIDRIEKETVYHLAMSGDADTLASIATTQSGTTGGNTANAHALQMISTLRLQQSGLEIRLAAERVQYGPQNPIVVQLKMQIDAIQKQLGQEIHKLATNAESDYKIAKVNEQKLHDALEKKQHEVSNLGNNLAALTFLREQEATGRKLYQDLFTRLQEANVASGVRSSSIAITDPARVPAMKSAPRFSNFILSGMICGLLLGLLAGGTNQLRDTRINIPEDFEESSPVPLLGVVPGFYEGTEKPYGAKLEGAEGIQDAAWILRKPKSQIAEAYRQIRTSLLLSSVDSKLRVMLVTSSLSGDGKSTTAYNLAAAFAAQSSRVILVEADLRRSSVAGLANVRTGPGLVDVLSGNKTLVEAVQVNPNLVSLHILTAGTKPPDPAELLGSQRFKDVMQTLRDTYEYVIVDAPPVLLVTDPVIAATNCDGIIAVVRAGRTTKPVLRRFWATLSLPNTKVVGFIVNDFHRKLQSYAYGYDLGAYGYYKRDGYYK